MKHLFRINRTDSKLSDKLDPTPFDTARITPELEAELDQLMSNALRDQPENAPIPGPGWKLWVGLALLIPVLVSVLFFRDSLFTAERAWLAWCGLGLMLVSAVLVTMARVEQSRRIKENAHSAPAFDFKAGTERLHALSDEAHDQLRIPRNAVRFDIFPYTYIMKGKTEKPAAGKGKYETLPLLAWRKGGMLCLSDSRVVLTIPAEAILGHSKVDEPFSLQMWLGECDCTAGRYKPFGLKKSGLMGARGRGWYTVQLRDGAGDCYELCVPCYDMNRLEKLVDIPALDPL